MSLVELRKHIVDAASYVVVDDPWFVSKIATAQDGSYYAKISAQDVSANGVYKWNGKTGEESSLSFYHFSDIPKGATILWEKGDF